MTRKLFRQLDKVMDDVQETIIDAFEGVLQSMSDESLKQAPLDKGDMRESYEVVANGKKIFKGSTNAVKRMDKTKIKDVIEYEASYNTPYALRQHEELSYNHPTPGTKAKYLEDPFMSHREYFVDDVQDAVNKELKK